MTRALLHIPADWFVPWQWHCSTKPRHAGQPVSGFKVAAVHDENNPGYRESTTHIAGFMTHENAVRYGREQGWIE